MEEETDDGFMHLRAFGKGQGFAHETAQALAECVVETFDMVGRPPMVGCLMLGGRQDIVIALQVVGMQWALTIGSGDSTPEQPGGGIAAGAEGIGHDLTGSATQGQPQPDHP